MPHDRYRRQRGTCAAGGRVHEDITRTAQYHSVLTTPVPHSAHITVDGQPLTPAFFNQ